MDVFYDTEFIEVGPHEPIRFISIGLVAGDGREYYAVTRNPDTIRLAVEHDWLRENVLPSLPIRIDRVEWHKTCAFRRFNWVWDRDHPDLPHVKARRTIAADVRDFLLADSQPRLWADYGAYDHVVLAQLFGRMIDLPAGVPMWTHDLRELAERAGDPELPPLMDGRSAHNALHDARELAFRRRWLRLHHGV